MPLQATSGAASYDAFGGGVAVVPVYIEQIFQTYLYTGNGSTQTITNGIDLSTKGGLVWTKCRSNAYSNYLIDTVQTKNKILVSNSTAAAITAYDSSYYGLTSFNSDGYSLGPDFTESLNTSGGKTFASWTFRRQPKFFDVVTYTGNGGTPQNIAHSLGSVPGFIVVKPTSTTGGWICYHRSLTASGFNPAPYNTINLNSSGSIMEDTGAWNSTAPTSTVFTIGSSPDVNTNGASYVAYLFAHDAGGFGLTGTDNVISCGSFDGTANTDVALGYEPQWIMFKNTTSASNWQIVDNMRGMFVGSADKQLMANLSNAESDNNLVSPTATGFTWIPSAAGNTYIYIAIRRGPMKVPTSGTSVFAPVARTGTGTATSISGVGFVPDFFLSQNRNVPGDPGPASSLSIVLSRLTNLKFLRTQTTSAEGDSTEVTSWNQSGVSLSADTFGRVNDTSVNTINYFIGRAPSFFDEVCYTGNGTAGRTITHNLTVAPELMIVKGRSNAGQWRVYSSALGATQAARLNSTDSFGSNPYAWNNTAPTASIFTVGDDTGVNENTYTYVAYLFATCAGVSKCGTFTGNGSSQTINCGFTGGARFVMIKATSTTGDWMVADSARGIVSGNDPYLELNNTNAEVTGEDWLDTDSTGFVVNQVSASNANTNGVTYIYLAIA